ncbi:MAG TPA: neutral/alkaline non-lysosomal ceramidase N-terminal domain-containing protein [Blastocatellia bacterium]|nr:neutral/alkaline non-lysosomal ceramidase N-terminal domain-containing protein [Blastocatellia bacterium]
MKGSVLLISLLLFMTVTAFAGELRVGVSAVVITPPPGTPLAGYYEPRAATGVSDDIYSKALVIEQGGMRVAIVVCDLLTLPRQTILAARQLIEQQTGIPAAHVMISATHQHTGPVVARESARDQLDGGTSEAGLRYTTLLPPLIARSVVEANQRLTIVRVAAAVGREEHLSFNRRFIMRDGTVSWNPRKQHPDISRPAGPVDPDVGVIYFETPQSKPIATFVNFAMHPDTTGGTKISADYPGVLARALADYKGAEMLTIFANGACGNLNHRNINWNDPQTGAAETRRIGTVLAGAVFKAWYHLKPLEQGVLKVRSEIVRLPLPEITAEDVAKANDVVKRLNDPKTTFMEKVKAFQSLDVAARRGEPWEVEVQVITLGNSVAWVSLPGEAFVELGLAIRHASPFPYTMIVELANGAIGYIPNKPAYAEGNYEVVSARCAAGSGEMLVAAASRMLREMFSPSSGR